MEYELVKCGKLAYTDFHANIKAEMKYLGRNYYWKQLYTIKESILFDNYAWKFRTVGWSKVKYYIFSRFYRGKVWKILERSSHMAVTAIEFHKIAYHIFEKKGKSFTVNDTGGNMNVLSYLVKPSRLYFTVAYLQSLDNVEN